MSAITTFEQEVQQVALVWVESELRKTKKEIEVVRTALNALEKLYRLVEDSWQKNQQLKQKRAEVISKIKHDLHWSGSYCVSNKLHLPAYEKTLGILERELSGHGY